MYHITLTENGRFCTHIGGPVQTLTEAIEQIKAVAQTVNAVELPNIFGYKFDRAGTICALIITDQVGFPIINRDKEEE